MMKPVIVILIILGGPSFFVLLWSGIIYMISYASGWQKLAESYSTTYMPTQTRSCSCLFRKSISYNGVVQYESTQKGLYLKTIKLFSIGHKPLLIPWEAIANYESGNLFASYKSRLVFYKFQIKVKGISIYINKDIRKIQTHE
ncbi:hypothetical protein GO730_27235 [Spirosoma sp. HMF3257]|nr:hypothetical protein [Spirosoma telluris]